MRNSLNGHPMHQHPKMLTAKNMQASVRCENQHATTCTRMTTLIAGSMHICETPQMLNARNMQNAGCAARSS